MIGTDVKVNIFEESIKAAIDCIKEKEFNLALKYIHESMVADDSAPETHNLLGALSELSGDLALARKHYRASYSLEPTFKPAIKNLERISNFSYKYDVENIDYGEKYISLNI